MDYKIICIGGAGGNISSALLETGIPKDKLFYINTDDSRPNYSANSNILLVGMQVTSGKGAGSNPELGKAIFYSEMNKFLSIVQDNCLYFLVGGFGGGTFSGISVEFAKLLVKLRKPFVVIGSMPFTFEGRRRVLQAISARDEIQSITKNAVIINNDDLRKYYGNMTLDEAFRKADYVISELFKEVILFSKYAEYNVRLIEQFINDSEHGVLIKIREFLKNDGLLSVSSSKIIIPDTNTSLLNSLKLHPDLIY